MLMKPILEVRNLTKIYEGGVLANHEVNFSVEEGEIHALVGENGAGKSTLMKMLYGMESVTSGQKCILTPVRMRSIMALVWCISILCWLIP